jgi:hypothetical protein
MNGVLLFFLCFFFTLLLLLLLLLSIYFDFLCFLLYHILHEMEYFPNIIIFVITL